MEQKKYGYIRVSSKEQNETRQVRAMNDLGIVSKNIRQLQAEGIEAAKLREVKFGRPAIPFPENFGEIYGEWKNKKI